MAAIVTGATVVATLGAGAMGVVAAVGPADDTVEVRGVAPITIAPAPSPEPEPEAAPAPQTTPTDAPAAPPAEAPAPQPAPVAPAPEPAPQAPVPVEVAPQAPHEIGDRTDWSRHDHDRNDGGSTWTDDDHDHDGDHGWHRDGRRSGDWNDDEQGHAD